MPMSNSLHEDDPTDALFDSSPSALCSRFADRMLERMRAGRDPYFMARLAASWAFLAEPSLRGVPTPQSALSEAIFSFGVAMAQETADRRKRLVH